MSTGISSLNFVGRWSLSYADNHVWAMDLVHDQLATGRKIRVLTVVDTFSRFSPAVDARFSRARMWFRRLNGFVGKLVTRPLFGWISNLGARLRTAVETGVTVDVSSIAGSRPQTLSSRAPLAGLATALAARHLPTAPSSWCKTKWASRILIATPGRVSSV